MKTLETVGAVMRGLDALDSGRSKVVLKTAKRLAVVLACCALVGAATGLAQETPRDYSGDLLESLSFNDTTNWSDDWGDMPLAWTNLVSVQGDVPAVLMDNTNGSWLQYNITQLGSDGITTYTNLMLAQGTVMFWFYLTNSASSNGWNLDPGQWGTFLEAGAYTPGASYGWWSLYSDGANVLFSAQDANGSQTNYLSAPLNWNPASNAWTHLALTYSASNGTQLYLNGALAASGLGMSVVPDLSVIGNSFYLGSSGASNQIHAAFDDVWFYDCPLDAETIAGYCAMYSIIYANAPELSAAALPMMSPAPSVSSTPDLITGPGFLQALSTNLSGCVTSNNVWITGMAAAPGLNQSVNVTFTISGGCDGAAYDVFAASTLGGGNITNAQWYWMGQGYHCVTYVLSNLPPSAAFLILGNAQDSDSDGLTDAFEGLVSKSNPLKSDTNGDGIPDGLSVLYGIDPAAQVKFGVWVATPSGFSGIP